MESFEELELTKGQKQIVVGCILGFVFFLFTFIGVTECSRDREVDLNKSQEITPDMSAKTVRLLSELQVEVRKLKEKQEDMKAEIKVDKKVLGVCAEIREGVETLTSEVTVALGTNVDGDVSCNVTNKTSKEVYPVRNSTYFISGFVRVLTGKERKEDD